MSSPFIKLHHKICWFWSQLVALNPNPSLRAHNTMDYLLFGVWLFTVMINLKFSNSDINFCTMWIGSWKYWRSSSLIIRTRLQGHYCLTWMNATACIWWGNTSSQSKRKIVASCTLLKFPPMMSLHFPLPFAPHASPMCWHEGILQIPCFISRNINPAFERIPRNTRSLLKLLLCDSQKLFPHFN